MDYSAAADALMRQKILEDIYSRMTDEERQLFMQLSMQDRSHAEVMEALRQQQSQLSRIQRTQQTFGEDFASNILGNAAWDGLVWLARRLFK